jgi:hypothetical protein
MSSAGWTVADVTGSDALLATPFALDELKALVRR